MCGIYGIACGDTDATIDRAKVGASLSLMKHRGPDASGQWGIPNKIELGHVRLSIIDLSAESNQPFVSTCGRFVIVFNGEIYNYIELRKELSLLGYVFRTQSDTEVLLGAYSEWGEKCVSRFNGDWAFAIYDRKEDLLFCSRDRFGVKPLNYAIVDGQFVFSSEIKSILHSYPALRQPDYNIIGNYIRNGHGAQAEQAWFAGIKRLQPAHNLIWKDGQATIRKYWDYPSDTLEEISLEEASKTYRELFTNAVNIRMRSDVPVGTTLSSGIDSGSIVSILRMFYKGSHKTFTATFDKSSFVSTEKGVYQSGIEIDETPLVKRLAAELGLDAHFISGVTDQYIDELSKVIYHLESGHSSPAVVPLYRIFGFARKYVTVVMEGQGADELLGGYIINTFPTLLGELLRRGKLLNAWRELRSFRKHYSLLYAAKMYVRLLNMSWLERLSLKSRGLNKVFGVKLRPYRRLADYPASRLKLRSRFNEVLRRSHSGGLVNLLHYGDAISMANSLESRLPFMDVNLVEYVFRLPYQMKAQLGVGKFIHRYAMKGIVPDFILSNPLKFGFNTPLTFLFAKPESEANRILLSDQCLQRGIFDERGLRSVIADQTSGRKDNSTFLFRLLSVELWFRRFIDCEQGLPSASGELMGSVRLSGAGGL